MAHDPEVSREAVTRGVCSERVSVWGYARRVVIQIDDGDESVSAHVTVEVARQHLRDVQAAIDAAVMLGG